MNAYELYMDYLFSKAGQRSIPLSGTFELTPRCNLNCKMCYIHLKENDAYVLKHELSTDYWIDLAEQCKSAGLLHLLLTGGEPLLRNDFDEIYTQCRKMGLLVSVNSNATLIDDRIIDLFLQHPPARVNITLYGASPETYQSLCGNAGAYNKVLRSIIKLKENGILVKLNSSVTPLNKRDMIPIYDFARNNDIPIQTATYMYPPARACEFGCTDSIRLSPEESARLQIEYDVHRIPHNELHERWQNQIAGVHIQDPENNCQEVPMERINCRAGHTTFWVTWDGKLRPCGMMTSPSIDICKNQFIDAWSELRKAREEIFVPEKCIRCDIRNACDQCAAICQAETGSFSEHSEYMCQRTKEYLRIISNKLNMDN